MTWSYRATAVKGVWMLLRDNVEVGGISFLDEAGWRPEMLVQDAVEGLNNPVPLAERGFGGAGGDALARRRQKLAQEGRR